MALDRKPRPKLPSLDERFDFHGDALAPGDRAALRPALFEVEDHAGGATRTVAKLRRFFPELAREQAQPINPAPAA